MESVNYQELYLNLTKRYTGITPISLEKILCPKLIPIKSIDKKIFKVSGQTHWRASFEIELQDDYSELMTIGRTGKFVPNSYSGGGCWCEIAKGRIISINTANNTVYGEIYTGGTKSELESAVNNLSIDDFLEIDQYGASAKILSALVEHNLSEIAKAAGYKVKRMPEDCAKHLGKYYNYDFEFEKNGVVKKVEVKSLWGTNTKCARLIHSSTPTNGYETSSCKFKTQDIFAVSLFLRTGNTMDFAFAKSISEDQSEYGLPHSTNYPDYVNQNPICEIGDGKWFSTIDEVWNL